MDLNFDIRGNLKPYETVIISTNNFRKIFVESFEPASNRKELFSYYEKYTQELTQLFKKSFYQWIDGSFISTKENPKDIDIVTIVDYQDYIYNKALLEKEFFSFAARRKYKVDAYIVPNYPKNHQKYAFTKSDLLYWQNLFGYTKASRSKRKFKKGIIQLNFPNHD